MRAIVTVVGKDRVGIIANVCNLLAKYQVNVLDISRRWTSTSSGRTSSTPCIGFK